MTEFLEVIEKELLDEYPKCGVEFGYIEDYIISTLPAILISPGTQSRKTSALNSKETNLNFSITIIDQHEPRASKEEVKLCEELISFIENNIEIKKRVVFMDSSFSTEIRKDEEDMNGTFFGKIKINTQLRR